MAGGARAAGERNAAPSPDPLTKQYLDLVRGSKLRPEQKARLDRILGGEKVSATERLGAPVFSMLTEKTFPAVTVAGKTRPVQAARKITAAALRRGGNLLESGARFRSGELKGTGRQRSVQKYGPLAPEIALVKDPRKALKGGWSALTRGTYDPERLNRDITLQTLGREPTVREAIGGTLVRGAEMDPLFFLPAGTSRKFVQGIGKATKLAAVTQRGAAARLATKGGTAGKIGKVLSDRLEIKEMENARRRLVESLARAHNELAAAAKNPAVADDLTRVIRAAEAVQEDALERAGNLTKAQAEQLAKDLAAAERAVRANTRAANRLTKEATAVGAANPRTLSKRAVTLRSAAEAERRALQPTRMVTLPSEALAGRSTQRVTTVGGDELLRNPEANLAQLSLPGTRLAETKIAARGARTAADKTMTAAGEAKVLRADRLERLASQAEGRAVTAQANQVGRLQTRAVGHTTKATDAANEATRLRTALDTTLGRPGWGQSGSLTDEMKTAAFLGGRERALPGITRFVQNKIDTELMALSLHDPAKATQLRGLLGQVQELGAAGREAGIRAGTLPSSTLKRPLYLWRGFERYQHPEEQLEMLRAMDPELAADLERGLLQRGAGPGTGGGAGIANQPPKARGPVSAARAAELGELPIMERLNLQGRIEGSIEANAWMLKRVARRWGKTVDELKRMSPKEQEAYFLIQDESKRWGALREKPVVPKWVAGHLGIISQENLPTKEALLWWALPARSGDWSRMGGLKGIGLGVVSAWKWAHVIGNPPTIGRNARSQAMMSYLLRDAPLWQVVRDLYWGYKGMGKGGRAAQHELAAFTPGFKATQLDQEIRQAMHLARSGGIRSFSEKFLDSPMGKLLVKGYEGMNRVFEVTEQAPKLGAYLGDVKSGLPKAQAARNAIAQGMDYGDVMRITRFLSRSGIIPFATWPVKAVQHIGMGALYRPGKYANVVRGIQATEAGARAKSPQVEQTRPFLPHWMADGKSIALPLEDKQGSTYWFSVAYEVPWGSFGEPGAGLDVANAIPIIGIYESVRRNEDLFTKKPIYNEQTDSDEVKAKKIGAYLASQFLPPITSRGLPRLSRALQGKVEPRKGGLEPYPVSLPKTLLGEVAGLRATPLRPEEQQVFAARAAKKAVDQAKRETRPVMGNEETTEQGQNLYQDAVNRILEEYQRKAAKVAAEQE